MDLDALDERFQSLTPNTQFYLNRAGGRDVLNLLYVIERASRSNLPLEHPEDYIWIYAELYYRQRVPYDDATKYPWLLAHVMAVFPNSAVLDDFLIACLNSFYFYGDEDNTLSYSDYRSLLVEWTDAIKVIDTFPFPRRRNYEILSRGVEERVDDFLDFQEQGT